MTGAIVAGIGFRHAAAAEAIVASIERALTSLDLPNARLAAIATAADRAGEAAIRAAAARFGLEPIGLTPAALRAVDAAVPTRSARIEAARGVGSLAEAAALAAAGPGGRLLLARIAQRDVTCALALRPETP